MYVTRNIDWYHLSASK